jgi:membrane protein implicated in regulation of membrane protease activity
VATTRFAALGWDHGVVPAWLLWLIAAGLFGVGEMVSLDLVLLMFAGGALGGMTVALLGGAVAFQLLAFIGVAAVLLGLVRPIAKRHLTDKTPLQLDGTETLIGRTATVTRAIDSTGGRIKLGADEWTARSQYDGEAFPIGHRVRIMKVDGATAVVGDALE